jgi:hypothetical protein
MGCGKGAAGGAAAAPEGALMEGVAGQAVAAAGSGLEWIRAQSGDVLAIVIRAWFMPDKTTFVTPQNLTQQAGFVVYPAGGRCPDHTHRPIERRINGTPEMLLVRRGQAEARIFDADRRLVAQPLLEQGDVILLVSGGHGFRMLEDTVLLEIKQGPYVGLDEKERFP